MSKPEYSGRRRKRARDKVLVAYGHYLGHRTHCKSGKLAQSRYYRHRQDLYQKRLNQLAEVLKAESAQRRRRREVPC